jgi:hypothetical protein
MHYTTSYKYITLRHIKSQEIINPGNMYEIPQILGQLKSHYGIYKRPSPVPTLGQLSPVHASPSNFL